MEFSLFHRQTFQKTGLWMLFTLFQSTLINHFLLNCLYIAETSLAKVSCDLCNANGTQWMLPNTHHSITFQQHWETLITSLLYTFFFFFLSWPCDTHFPGFCLCLSSHPSIPSCSVHSGGLSWGLSFNHFIFSPLAIISISAALNMIYMLHHIYYIQCY